MQATVKTIGLPSGLTPIGLLYPSDAPPGSRVQLKQCENCVRTFVRAQPGSFRPFTVTNRGLSQGPSDGPETSTIYLDTGERFCPICRSRMLLPDERLQQEVKDQLPTEGQMGHSNHLIRYDDSLVPREQRTVYRMRLGIPTKKRIRRSYGDWKTRVIEALRSRGPLSCEQLQDAIGSVGGPNAAYALIAGSSIGPLLRVGHAVRRVGVGKVPGLYTIPQFAKDHQCH